MPADDEEVESETDSFDTGIGEPGNEDTDQYKLPIENCNERTHLEETIKFVVSLWEFGVTIRKTNQILIKGKVLLIG